MRFKQALVGFVVAIVAVAAFAQLREGSAGSSVAAYKVTPWPNHAPDNSYLEEVEQYLNHMASNGWRFHSEVSGQGAKGMLFEKAGK